MERVSFLIDKLHTQQQAGESAAQLLQTVQQLYQALVPQPADAATGGSQKVAVILPSLPRISATVIEASAPVITEPVIPVTVVSAPPPEPEPLSSRPSYAEPYSVQRPLQVAEVAVAPAQEVVAQPVPESHAFYALEETPTYIQQVPPLAKKEVHETIGDRQASLNDRLKEEKTELVNALKDAPIKDLRKGIGVNDKFLFINELFRGDEANYERSIKTINSFHILPEAEYWMNRELKVKLGWNDNKETVQHFYALVRRRFS